VLTVELLPTVTATPSSVAVVVVAAGSAVTVKVAEDPDDPGDPGTPLPLATPELAEAEAAATALGWPVRAVLEAALAAYRERA